MEHWKNLSLDNIVEEIDGVVYTEEWKDILGYENLYQISTFGRVRNYPLVRLNYISKRKIKKIRFDSRRKYLTIDLNINKHPKTFLLHRLVGIVHIPNPQNLEIVNHKFGNTRDNRAIHLEWCTKSQNAIHAYRILNIKSSAANKFGELNHKSIRIEMIEKESNQVKEIFFGAGEIHRKYGYDTSSIHKCCKNKIKSYKGYKWKYSLKHSA